jgi:hypothetical protein
MSTTPQLPRAPVAPPPPRTGGHILAIVLLVLALIVVVSVMTVWIGLRILTRGVSVRVEEGKKEVAIHTPLGSLEVNREVDESRLGLPLYPGAQRVKGEGSASVNIAIGDEGNVRVLAAKFETSDPLDKVKRFYKERLGSDVTKYIERNHEGKTVFEIKREHQEKVVALKGEGERTSIELVRVTHGREESN